VVPAVIKRLRELERTPGRGNIRSESVHRDGQRPTWLVRVVPVALPSVFAETLPRTRSACPSPVQLWARATLTTQVGRPHHDDSITASGLGPSSAHQSGPWVNWNRARSTTERFQRRAPAGSGPALHLFAP